MNVAILPLWPDLQPQQVTRFTEARRLAAYTKSCSVAGAGSEYAHPNNM